MTSTSPSSRNFRIRLLTVSAAIAVTLMALPAPAAGEATQELHVLALMPVVLDVATGRVHECDQPDTLDSEGVAICATYQPAIFTHVHNLDPDLDVLGPQTNSHPTGTDGWSEDNAQSDGTRIKSCGYWHAERYGIYPACDNIWPSSKTISQVLMYRCLTTQCTSDHWTTGILHSDVLTPSSFSWWHNFQNGVYRGGSCSGSSGSASSVATHQASLTRDHSLTGCATGWPKGLMGGGVRYWP